MMKIADFTGLFIFLVQAAQGLERNALAARSLCIKREGAM